MTRTRFHVARHVMGNDIRQILRDPRSLFVHFLLPIIMLPLFLLGTAFVMQVVHVEDAALPVVASVGLDPAIDAALRDGSITGSLATTALSEDDEVDKLMNGGVTGYRYERIDDTGLIALFQRLVRDLPDDDSIPAAALDPITRDDLFTLLRTHGWTCVIVAHDRPLMAGSSTGILITDQSAPFLTQALRTTAKVLRSYEKDTIRDRTQAAGLAEDFAVPIHLSRLDTAELGELMRVGIGSILPAAILMLMLSMIVNMAAELVTGERERGTMEALMALPGQRGGLFFGKLATILVMCCASFIINMTVITAMIGSITTLTGSIDHAISGLSGVVSGMAALTIGLMPVILLIASATLCIAGLAQRTTEVMYYLGPLSLVIMGLAMVSFIPSATPSLSSDILPIIGPILCIKETFTTGQTPYLHFVASSIATGGFALMVIAWSLSLFEDERYIYPSMFVGWGRFRRCGTRPTTPGGIESFLLFSGIVGVMIICSLASDQADAVSQLVATIAIGIALPLAIHWLLGGYHLREMYLLHWPGLRAVSIGLLLAPLAAGASILIGSLQSIIVGEMPEAIARQLQHALDPTTAAGGLPVLIVALVLLPAIFEELLCRGVLLIGIRKSLGPVAAVLLSAALFALLHGSPWRLFPQFVLGVIAAVVTLRYRSLLPAIILHAGHNAIIAIAYLGR